MTDPVGGSSDFTERINGLPDTQSAEVMQGESREPVAPLTEEAREDFLKGIEGALSDLNAVDNLYNKMVVATGAQAESDALTDFVNSNPVVASELKDKGWAEVKAEHKDRGDKEGFDRDYEKGFRLPYIERSRALTAKMFENGWGQSIVDRYNSRVPAPTTPAERIVVDFKAAGTPGCYSDVDDENRVYLLDARGQKILEDGEPVRASFDEELECAMIKNFVTQKQAGTSSEYFIDNSNYAKSYSMESTPAEDLGPVRAQKRRQVMVVSHAHLAARHLIGFSLGKELNEGSSLYWQVREGYLEGVEDEAAREDMTTLFDSTLAYELKDRLEVIETHRRLLGTAEGAEAEVLDYQAEALRSWINTLEGALGSREESLDESEEEAEGAIQASSFSLPVRETELPSMPDTPEVEKRRERAQDILNSKRQGEIGGQLKELLEETYELRSVEKKLSTIRNRLHKLKAEHPDESSAAVNNQIREMENEEAMLLERRDALDTELGEEAERAELLGRTIPSYLPESNALSMDKVVYGEGGQMQVGQQRAFQETYDHLDNSLQIKQADQQVRILAQRVSDVERQLAEGADDVLTQSLPALKQQLEAAKTRMAQLKSQSTQQPAEPRVSVDEFKPLTLSQEVEASFENYVLALSHTSDSVLSDFTAGRKQKLITSANAKYADRCHDCNESISKRLLGATEEYSTQVTIPAQKRGAPMQRVARLVQLHTPVQTKGVRSEARKKMGERIARALQQKREAWIDPIDVANVGKEVVKHELEEIGEPRNAEERERKAVLEERLEKWDDDYALGTLENEAESRRVTSSGYQSATKKIHKGGDLVPSRKQERTTDDHVRAITTKMAYLGLVDVGEDGLPASIDMQNAFRSLLVRAELKDEEIDVDEEVPETPSPASDGGGAFPDVESLAHATDSVAKPPMRKRRGSIYARRGSLSELVANNRITSMSAVSSPNTDVNFLNTELKPFTQAMAERFPIEGTLDPDFMLRDPATS